MGKTKAIGKLRNGWGSESELSSKHTKAFDGYS